MRCLSFVILWGGCTPKDIDDDSAVMNSGPGGDIMEEEGCASTETPLTMDDTTPLGFTVAEAIEWVTSTWMGAMAHADGGTTQGVVQTEWTGGPIAFVTHDDSTNGNEIGCLDHLRVAVPLTLSTEDGTFAFSLSVEALFIAVEEWSASAETGAEENLGSHEPGGGTYRVSRAGSAGEESGDVAVITEGSDGEAVWISQEVVLSWPEVP